MSRHSFDDVNTFSGRCHKFHVKKLFESRLNPPALVGLIFTARTEPGKLCMSLPVTFSFR